MIYQSFALNLARQAGKIIRANFRLGMKKQIKKDGSPVTKTDLAINSLVIKEVKKHFPSHAVIGEEENYINEKAEYAWVCDPVDGTISFSHGMPTCAFSLALVHNGRPILGVAYDPFMDRLVIAEKGRGTRLNGRKIRVSGHRRLTRSAISYGLWHSATFKTLNLGNELVFKHKTEPFPVGSIVYNAILLAAGEIEGIIFPHHTAHDIAAIKVIVEEAGGKVTDLYGNEQRYDRPVKGAVITNGLIHRDLLKVIKKHLKA